MEESKRSSSERVLVEVQPDDYNVTLNVVFLDTGEIRQKRRSINWMFNCLFRSELRTWKKRGEFLVPEKMVFYCIENRKAFPIKTAIEILKKFARGGLWHPDHELCEAARKCIEEYGACE